MIVFDDIEYKGYWWLPDNPEVKLSGKLSITPGKDSILELQGPFDKDLRWIIGFRPTLIHGVANSKPITLYCCYLGGKRMSFWGSSEFTFSVQFVFVDVHFTDKEQIGFRNLYVRFAHLNEWINRSSLHYEYEKNSHNFLIRHLPNESVVATVKDCHIEACTGYHLEEGKFEAHLFQNSSIIFSFEQDKALQDCLGLVYKTRDFLSLAVGTPIHILGISGRTSVSKMILEDGREIMTPIELYFDGRKKSEKKAVMSSRMLFTLDDIRDQFEYYLEKWFNTIENYRPVYNLFFSTIYKPDEYLESKFLSLIQALETYHRRRFGGQYQLGEEYSEGLYKLLVATIPADTDKDFKQALKQGKLKYANEYSLRKRLTEIMNDLVENRMLSGFSSKEHRKTIVEIMCDTRNYLTHYTDELQGRAAQGHELSNLTIFLGIILQIYLLRETGFEFSVIRDILMRQNKYKDILLGNTRFKRK